MEFEQTVWATGKIHHAFVREPKIIQSSPSGPRFRTCAGCHPRNRFIFSKCVEKSRRPIGIDMDGENLATLKHPQSAILDLFTPEKFEAGSLSSDSEREAKRKRLNTGDSSAVHSENSDVHVAGTINESDSVVLAKVALELSFPDYAERKHTQSSAAHTDPIDVALGRFGIQSENEYGFTLWSVKNPKTGIDMAVRILEQGDHVSRVLGIISTELYTIDNGEQYTPATVGTFSRCVLYPLAEDLNKFRLEAEIRMRVGITLAQSFIPTNEKAKRDWMYLNEYFRQRGQAKTGRFSVSDFYESVHVPSKDLAISPRIKDSTVDTALYPFQERAVDWLLRREGVEYSSTGNLQPLTEFDSISALFVKTQDAAGRDCYVSMSQGTVATDIKMVQELSGRLRGGILAEEMGLGKTIEMISLIRHHTRQVFESNLVDGRTGYPLKPSGSTLIITPPSILEQWKSELQKYAPELKVLHYQGLASAKSKKIGESHATIENLMKYDVVLTTYSVLSREVHYAKPPPERSFRHEKKHQPQRTPLVQISWWRVCIDEAQMIENGVSQAAMVAQLLPRCNAWAVSGTPLARTIDDLRGLLMFLRFEPIATHKPVWDRLDRPSFQRLFGQIALRHSKDKIRNELSLPPQKRVVITVPFTAIEEQNYSEMHRHMCDDCDLTSEGAAIENRDNLNKAVLLERMEEWLRRLRQTCLHAHVGRKNRKALGAKKGPLRSIHDVLEIMIDQNDTQLKAEAQKIILAKITAAHITNNVKKADLDRRSDAFHRYQDALRQTQTFIKGIRNELAAEKEKVGVMEVDTSHNVEDFDEQEWQNSGHIPTIRKSLRSFLELEHTCDFFIATVYYQMKCAFENSPTETQRLDRLEAEWYEKAKQVRQELLGVAKTRAQKHMDRVSARKPFHEIPKVEELDDHGGIESRKILETMDDLTGILNEQATQLVAWRQQIIDILLLPLVDEDADKDTTGNEYEKSTEVQDRLYVYIMALRTSIADRGAIINGLADALVDHELKEAERRALDSDDSGHAPQLVLEVVRKRREILPKSHVGSLKGAVSAARSLVTTLQSRSDDGDKRAMAELTIAQKLLANIQSILNEQTKALTELDKEQDDFRAVMNHRLEFYRQLQAISDTVAPWKEHEDETMDRVAFANEENRRVKAEAKMKDHQKRQSYLTNLRTESQIEAQHECIICQDTFEIGVLTKCGHKYCKECIIQWWHDHRTCPLCKTKLRSSDFRDINFKPSVVHEEEVQGGGESSQSSTPSQSKSSIYSDVSESMMSQIKTIDLRGSYGSKIDMMARHLLWIRNNDPGAKSLIFSQFGDFLDVFREALNRWGIGCSSIRDPKGTERFLSDPSVECFLLDAKSDSSGLNLVNASYVFLCEPLINPAIELQAIARVHRIGQQRQTTVFMYLIRDTVEEVVYQISVERRLAHMSRTTQSSGTTTPALAEKTIEAANSLQLQTTGMKQLLCKKGDGERVKAEDLWKCLFGRPRKPWMADRPAPPVVRRPPPIVTAAYPVVVTAYPVMLPSTPVRAGPPYETGYVWDPESGEPDFTPYSPSFSPLSPMLRIDADGNIYQDYSNAYPDTDDEML